MKLSRDTLVVLRTGSKPRALSILIGLALCSLGGYYLLPWVLSIYHQGQANQILQTILQSQSAPQAVTTYCHPDPLSPDQQQMLVQAASHLSQAMEWQASEQVYLLQARSACLAGDSETALSAYQNYARLRPENPLGALELGLALVAICQPGNTLMDSAVGCPDSEQLDRLWQQAQVDFERLPELARSAFQHRNFSESYGLYQLNEFYAPEFLTGPDLFAYGVSAILAGQPQPESSKAVLRASHLAASLQIEAEEMQWLRSDPDFNLSYGDPLRKHSSASEVGVFWWNGSAIALIDVVRAGTYQVTLRAQDRPPAPILLALELNLETVADFELADGDNSWQDLQAEINISSGLQIIGVRFKNDASIDGVPRDAIVDWLRIESP